MLTKKSLLYLVFLFTQPFVLSAGQISRAVIMESSFYRITSDIVSPDYFPDFFYYPEFINDIYNDILKYTSEKFDADTIEFTFKDSVSVEDVMVLPGFDVNDYIHTADSSVIYVNTRTIIKSGNRLNDDDYLFITEVLIFNDFGEILHSFGNRIPFASYYGEFITDRSVLGENDFYSLFLDGLELAFQGEVEETELFYFEKPQARNYNQFIANSQRFYLKDTNNTYLYGSSKSELYPVLEYSPLQNEDKKVRNFLDNITGYHRLPKGYQYTNTFSGSSYVIRYTNYKESVSNYISDREYNSIEIFNSEFDTAGAFSMINENVIKGYLHNSVCKIEWKDLHSCYEITIFDDRVALLYEPEKTRHLYVSRSIDESQLKTLFDLLFVCDILNFRVDDKPGPVIDLQDIESLLELL